MAWRYETIGTSRAAATLRRTSAASYAPTRVAHGHLCMVSLRRHAMYPSTNTSAGAGAAMLATCRLSASVDAANVTGSVP